MCDSKQSAIVRIESQLILEHLVRHCVHWQEPVAETYLGRVHQDEETDTRQESLVQEIQVSSHPLPLLHYRNLPPLAKILSDRFLVATCMREIIHSCQNASYGQQSHRHLLYHF